MEVGSRLKPMDVDDCDDCEPCHKRSRRVKGKRCEAKGSKKRASSNKGLRFLSITDGKNERVLRETLGEPLRETLREPAAAVVTDEVTDEVTDVERHMEREREKVGYDTDEDDSGDWYLGGQGLGAGVFDDVEDELVKIFVGGRVTKFEPLTSQEINEIDLDILPLIRSKNQATVRRACFGVLDETMPRHSYRKAISYGCSVALHMIEPPRHVVVICSYDFKANWIRSNIHIQAEGGGVLSHPEFAAVWASDSTFKALDFKLRRIFRNTEGELGRTLFVIQGTSALAQDTLRIMESRLHTGTHISKILILRD